MTRRELAVCIYNHIKEIKLGHNNKLPSERELASLFNVSRPRWLEKPLRYLKPSGYSKCAIAREFL